MGTFYSLMVRAIVGVTLCFFFSSVDAQEIISFQGIPIEGNVKVFLKQIKKHGFNIDWHDATSYHLLGKCFSNAYNDIVWVLYTPHSKEVWGVVINTMCIGEDSWESVRNQYLSTVKLLTPQNGVESESTVKEYFENPYSDGDGQEIEAISKGCCHFETTFWTPQGRISVSIAKYDKYNFTKLTADSGKIIPIVRVAYVNEDGLTTNKKETAPRL